MGVREGGVRQGETVNERSDLVLRKYQEKGMRKLTGE